MADKDVSPELADQKIGQMTGLAEQERLDYLDHEVQAGTAEAEQLRIEKEALEKKLGPDHPRVLALERARRSAEVVTLFATTVKGHAEFGAKGVNVSFTVLPPEEPKDDQRSGCLTAIKRAFK